MTTHLTNQKTDQEIRQFWHDVFSPFNPGRDFVVLFGSNGKDPSMALLQLDGGAAIETGGIQPQDMDGNKIQLIVQHPNE